MTEPIRAKKTPETAIVTMSSVKVKPLRFLSIFSLAKEKTTKRSDSKIRFLFLPSE